MLTLFFILALTLMFICTGLTVQQWLCKNAAEKRDLEWELYQQRYD